jgi:hypothetical protein
LTIRNAAIVRFMESKNTTSLFLQGDERGRESETETDRQTGFIGEKGETVVNIGLNLI